MTKPISKRRSERIAASIPVRWIRRTGALNLTAADINLHGMFLPTTNESVLPGELMQLEVELPQVTLNMFVIARFVGRTASGHGIGVEIFVMDEQQQAKWAENYRAMSRRKREARPVAVAAAGR